MNVTAEIKRPVAVAADDLLGAEAVLHGHQRRFGPVAAERGRGRVELRRLRRDDREVGFGKVRRIGGGAHLGDERVPPRHAQSLLDERAGVLLPPAEDRHVASRARGGRRRGCRSPRRRPRRRARSAPLPAGQEGLPAAPCELVGRHVPQRVGERGAEGAVVGEDLEVVEAVPARTVEERPGCAGRRRRRRPAEGGRRSCAWARARRRRGRRRSGRRALRGRPRGPSPTGARSRRGCRPRRRLRPRRSARRPRRSCSRSSSASPSRRL